MFGSKKTTMPVMKAIVVEDAQTGQLLGPRVNDRFDSFGSSSRSDSLPMPVQEKQSPNMKGAKNLDEAIRERSGLGQQPAADMAFEFTCENKKCRAKMQISASVFKQAVQEDLRAKKFKGKPQVGVECDKCGKVHNLVMPPGMLD